MNDAGSLHDMIIDNVSHNDDLVYTPPITEDNIYNDLHVSNDEVSIEALGYNTMIGKKID